MKTPQATLRIRGSTPDATRFERTALAVLFDLDGTLCDTLSMHFAAYNRALDELGVGPLGWSEFTDACIQKGEKVINVVKRLHPNLRRSRFYELKNKHYADLVGEGLSLRKGVAQLVERVQQVGLALAVVTSSSRQSVEFALAKCWPFPPPDVIVTYDDCQIPKPDAAPYTLALRRLQRAPDRCVAFEDSLVGVRAAKAALMSCVALSTSLVSREMLSNEADFVFDSFEDVDVHDQASGVRCQASGRHQDQGIRK